MTPNIFKSTEKFFTPWNVTIDSLDAFSFKASECTSIFKEQNKIPTLSRVYITFKIESSHSLSYLKHGSNNHVENIFDTLKKNNAFLRHDKFMSHKEYSLWFFVEVNPRVTLRETLRRRIHDKLMWIDLDAEVSQYMIHQDMDSKWQSTCKERIIIPSFDIYGRKVGNVNAKDRVTTFTYEIRCAPDKASMLKNLLCNIPSESFLTSISSLMDWIQSQSQIQWETSY